MKLDPLWICTRAKTFGRRWQSKKRLLKANVWSHNIRILFHITLTLVVIELRQSGDVSLNITNLEGHALTQARKGCGQNFWLGS